jgi:hypothetical protein
VTADSAKRKISHLPDMEFIRSKIPSPLDVGF